MGHDLRLMAVLAHPDDETLGFGGVLAKYSDEGIDTTLVVASLGERGWQGPRETNPGLAAVGSMREQELAAAADVLGIHTLCKLGYIDGEILDADPREMALRIAGHIRNHQPHVIVTFDPSGAYGHPDHIAVSQSALAAAMLAADPASSKLDGPPHLVSKFYYRVWNNEENEAYSAVFGDLAMEFDGQVRRFSPWEEWAITTRIDTKAYWKVVWQAVQEHRSQVPSLQMLAAVSDELKIKIFGCEGYYRAFSTVNGGREREDDLFEGLRG